MSTSLKHKVTKSHEILKKALKQYGTDLAIAWTGGKDSTIMLHMIKVLRGRVDLPIIYLDTQLDAKETYVFMQQLSKDWDFPFYQVGDPEGLKRYQAAKTYEEKSLIAAEMKIQSLKNALAKYQWPALGVAIRSDEHPDRGTEQPVSKRKDHTRIHPILHFTEQDVWDYIYEYDVPYNPLYDQGYRSLGEEELTKPTPKGGNERSGRDQAKEAVMKRLRGLGYF
jgi:phosphoadenosine phosphosulfate reductase